MYAHQHNTCINRHTARGFTLIEVMITVVIVALLAAIALPSYTRYAVRVKRSAAQSVMVNLANKEEQYLLDARVYTTSLPNLGFASTPPEIANDYIVTIVVGTGTIPTYLITAAPIGNQLAKDTDCGQLTLDQSSTKGIQNGTSTAGACW